MKIDWELYDENNLEHNDTSIYEVMEWSNQNDSDCRHPNSVEIGTIFDDAKRRDFTVNAMYFRLSDSKLLDPTAMGFKDIKNNKLRFVGNPKDRLNEDSLRAFRFYRFVQKGFEPVASDLRQVRTMFKKCKEETDSTRIMNEIEKMAGL